MGFPVVSTAMRKIFGTRNERMVKKYLRIVDEVNSYEEQIRQLTDAELRGRTDAFRERISKGESAEELLPEVFAVAREAMDRSVGIRNIFNPDAGFDPAQLPADARALYDKVKQEIDSTEPAEPEGDFLGCEESVPAWQFVDIPNELYNAVRELYPESKPPFRARPFDVQIIGAVVLYEGRIAEMKTGEGKTIVAPLATYLAALEGHQVHVVTVNDYLVQRDRDWTFPFFRELGLTIGAIHPYHMQPPDKKKLAYSCNVVYGTTAEFGFDYLRDNMKLSPQDQVQKHRDFAIVDEVDSTLIDEARTPLIISGAAQRDQPRYELADQLARHLIEKQKEWNDADEKVQSCKVEISGLEGDIRTAADKSKVPALRERLEKARKRLPVLEAERDKFTQYYEIELDKKKAQLTHEGIAEAQRKAGIGSFYVGQNMDLPHLLENAIRAHTVYQRDRDYVVAPDEEGKPSVVIVDQNTGRKMVGRQWSDGLHQAAEAKEGVSIKQETQTMATVTIQNFFKLYKKLAGMTGTADTEATEFYEIYKLDVVCIPTNVPVRRADHNDVVFMSVKDKWDAVVDEIKACHDIGQPVLVGTTSVESSEMLSQMLTKKHSIKHEVLNAKQHEREADIIAGAGQLGAVMIATNMAGRGTDIKLGRLTTEQMIDHWKRRGICPKHVTAKMSEAEIVTAVYRHVATRELDLSRDQVEQMSDEDVRRALLEKWAMQFAWIDEAKARKMTDDALMTALDESKTCRMHHLRLYKNIEDLGGLHVVGTERHESRRIDNQLRGRSGRQGDRGSSRFFLSLEDDLMKRFAGPTTLKLLSKMGMKEGVALESRMLTRQLERAQRKVEERNFLIRKNILEYDEPMDMQRGEFYGMRQDVLEGRRITEIIFDNVEEAVADACFTYLSSDYTAKCVAEWIREHLNVSIPPERIMGKDREDLHKAVRVNAKEDAASEIRLAIGEYMSDEAGPEEWDFKSLADWGNTNFDAGATADELRDMSPTDVQRRFEEASEKKIDAADLSPLDRYLVGDYGRAELAKWVNGKFDTEFEANQFKSVEESAQAIGIIMDAARKAYAKREVRFPIEYAIEMTGAMLRTNPQQSLQQFCAWVKARYDVDWNWQQLPSPNPAELRDLLTAEAEKWDSDRIAERATRILSEAQAPDAIEQWFEQNMLVRFTEDEKKALRDPGPDGLQKVVADKIATTLRSELTMFERQVLLQIFDTAWKEHLYAMDQLRESIGLRAVGQRDPRIEFKREAGRLFDEMYQSIRDKVTELVFKGRLGIPQVPQQQQEAGEPGQQQPQQGVGQGQAAAAQPGPSAMAAAAAAAPAPSAAQQRDLDAAMRAGASSEGGTQTRSRPKSAPARAAPTVGRNEPCPCGSGKKYKQCCGKRK